MRIGELDDAVGREFTARRNAMAAETSRLASRLAEDVAEAARPAVPLLDSVRISPEARAAGFDHVRSSSRPALPGPAQLVEALARVLASRAPGESAAAGKVVAQLVRQLVELPPGSFPGRDANPAGSPALAARALVNAVLAHGPAAPSAAAIARLARELLGTVAPAPGSAAALATPPERAAVEILLASMNAGMREPALVPSHGQPSPAEIPPALLGLLVPPEFRRRSDRRRVERKYDEPGTEEDAESGEDPPTSQRSSEPPGGGR